MTFVGYALLNTETTMEVVSPKIERVEVEKKVTIDALEVRIKEAQEAARAEIEAKADEMRAEYIANEMKTIEIEVREAHGQENEQTIVELKKETGAY